jgi:hydrogenase expression/formation protein HypD
MLDRIVKAQNLMTQACKTLDRPINIMEVCGTHTVAIFRNGIRTTLPRKIKLLSGPGCPVCVTDQTFIDTMLTLAERDDCIIATYGDMIRVPGTNGSLETKQNKNVKVILSSDDALTLAKNNPRKTIVFIAVGFETTTPATAVVVREAQQNAIDNFCILCAHKRVVPAMGALLADNNNKIDAFLCPGHVSVIIGSDAYTPIVEEFKRPCVVAGFEPMHIIEGIAEICRQLFENSPAVSSLYDAAVTPKGNTTAQKIIDRYFQPCDDPWRGLGNIPNGSLKLKEDFSQFDAMKRFDLEQIPSEKPSACQCGAILCGLLDPPKCPLFETECTPDTPVGPCMVSSEGACAAWYKYGRKKKTT